MTLDWQPLDSAPRDGTLIDITAIDDDGEVFEIHPMVWDPSAKNAIFAPGMVGMWVAPGGEYTWREGEGGPTHWRPHVPDKRSLH